MTLPGPLPRLTHTICVYRAAAASRCVSQYGNRVFTEIRYDTRGTGRVTGLLAAVERVPWSGAEPGLPTRGTASPGLYSVGVHCAVSMIVVPVGIFWIPSFC